jgi:hypothetical protein
MKRPCASDAVSSAECGVNYKPLKPEQLSQSLAPGTVVVNDKDTVELITSRVYRSLSVPPIALWSGCTRINYSLRIDLVDALTRTGTNTIVQLCRE